MSFLINVGFGNSVNTEKVLAVVSPSAAPVKRMVTHAKDAGHLIDATQGRKTKAVIVLNGGWLMISALQPETILRRFNMLSNSGMESSVDEDIEETEETMIGDHREWEGEFHE